MTSFYGSIEDLKAIVDNACPGGTWEERPNGLYVFTSRDRAVLNWWGQSKKGTLNVQGPMDARERLQQAVLPALGGDFPKVDPKKDRNNTVFVVYGHEKEARTQLDAMLRRWGLEPLILDELPSKGQTIIEKLEEYTEDVGFAVVLATPDDEGHRVGHPEEQLLRARQNVVLELGMMLKQLGRDRVAILMKGQEKMERPSDIQGLIYIAFKDDLQREAGPMLAKEMTAVGYEIDVARL